MSLDFKVCKIGDLGNIFSGGTPSTKIKEYWENGVPVRIETNLAERRRQEVENGK